MMMGELQRQGISRDAGARPLASLREERPAVFRQVWQAIKFFVRWTFPVSLFVAALSTAQAQAKESGPSFADTVKYLSSYFAYPERFSIAPEEGHGGLYTNKILYSDGRLAWIQYYRFDFDELSPSFSRGEVNSKGYCEHIEVDLRCKARNCMTLTSTKNPGQSRTENLLPIFFRCDADERAMKALNHIFYDIVHAERDPFE